MAKPTMTELLDQLNKDGHTKKAIVSDATMKQFVDAFEALPGVLATPNDELRYMEGLLELPLGFVKQFSVVPAAGYERCKCGRVPSALEIVSAAVRLRIHDKQLMRDTIIGFQNLVEIAKDGRQGDCLSCGRTMIMGGYWTHHYMYA
jgi:hypothetical protein